MPKNLRCGITQRNMVECDGKKDAGWATVGVEPIKNVTLMSLSF